MKRVVSAHQPNFLPYLGFFDKMMKSDVFVIRDEVQFVERDYHHRNRIRVESPPGSEPQSKWVRVPVAKEQKELGDIRIRNEVRDKNVPWNICLLRQIKSSYEKAPRFAEYFEELEAILLVRTERLLDLNMAVIDWLRDCFGLSAKVMFASQLKYGKTGDPTLDLVRIAQVVDADVYLSGSGGRAYLNQAAFEAKGIEVAFQAYEHPVYPQRYPGFVANLAAIDALFNVGNIFSGQPVKPSTFEGATSLVGAEVA